jgi:hypothetical protein
VNVVQLHILARKISAISFVLLILIGHFWALLLFLGKTPSGWLQVGFFIGTFGALAGGAGLVLLKIAAIIRAAREDK